MDFILPTHQEKVRGSLSRSPPLPHLGVTYARHERPRDKKGSPRTLGRSKMTPKTTPEGPKGAKDEPGARKGSPEGRPEAPQSENRPKSLYGRRVFSRRGFSHDAFSTFRGTPATESTVLGAPEEKTTTHADLALSAAPRRNAHF